MTVPCKNCPDRDINCHCHCPRYAEYNKERERIRQRQWIHNQQEGIEIDRKKKIQRRKAKK